MFQILTIVILIAAILLILIVLVQNSKGGGLASNFAGGNQFGGVAEQKSKLENTTWILICVIVACSIIASVSKNTKDENTAKSITKERLINQNNVPVIPQTVNPGVEK